MAKKLIGLTSIEMGNIAGDGGMGLSLTPIGATVQDSMAMTTEEGTSSDFNIEESDSPFYSIISTAGKVVLNWSTYDMDLDTLARFWGGTVVTGPPRTWDMPDTLPALEKSVKITTKDGWIFNIARMSINAKLQANFKKTALGQLDITGTVLQPTKAGEKRVHVIEPV